ncbi:cell division protein FtsW [bacterium]|nr:cell division protein FtsW [bacterium]
MLSLISILAIYSSTKSIAYALQEGNTEYYILKHLVMMFFGFGVIYIAHKIDYKFYSGFSRILLPLSILLMLLTYAFGLEINDAKRWLPLPGTGLTIQTSDIAKLALIMYLARTIAKKQEVISDFKKGFLPIMLPILAVCLIIAPSDFSTAATLLFTSIVLLFIGRANIKHIGIVLLSAVVGLAILVMLAQIFDWDWLRWSTWVSRFSDYFGSGDGSFQNQQAKIAIARGGFFGVGPGNSVQRNFLPNPYADFIFAIIVEEYGMMGAIVIIFLYLTLLNRSIRIIIKSPNSFGPLLGVGLTMSLVIQAFLNMGVAVHLFPNTGLPLPLISMGGTSLVFTCFAFGVILSVSAFIEQTNTEKAK